MTATYDFAGWKALVTGSTKGIGLATARLLAASGAEVFVHGSDQARTQSIAAGIAGARAVHADMAVRESRDALCDQVIAGCDGRLDILVHNASIFPQGNIRTQSPDEFAHVLAINVEAVYHTTRRLLAVLEPSDHPAIVIVSSAVFRMGLADSPAYAASKAAQIGLTRHLAAELGPLGVRVNALLPGLVDTPGTRAVRVEDASYERFAAERQMLRVTIQPEDIAHGVAFLCSPAARVVTAASLDMNAGSVVGG